MEVERMNKYSTVGKRIPRIDGMLKATGEAKYADDLSLPNMLIGKILRSPYPHARILNVNTSKAQRLTGVKTVITGRDIPGGKFGGFGGPLSDQYPIVPDKVRYIGDEVAAVAAIDEDTAEEAMDLIEVEYEPLPAVFDPEEAMKPDAPKIHDHAERNICSRISLAFGDVDKGFEEAHIIREDKFLAGVDGALAHCQMEPHAALATFDSSRKVTLWAPNMSPFVKRRNLAKTLKMPETQIRVAKVHVGGAFGGKSEMFSNDFSACFLSKKTGRPVKITYTREEVFTSTRQRHPMIINLKTGVKKDGIISAVDCKIIGDTGAYASVGPASVAIPGANMAVTYKIPNMKYESFCVYTNKSIRGAMRGHGMIQFSFAKEAILDMLAEELGMEPMEIRLKNAMTGNTNLPLGGMVTSCALTECVQKAIKEVEWIKKGERENIGFGMGCGSCATGVMMSHDAASAAFIKFNEDGGASLITGAVDTGTGSYTILSQIVAEELGLSVEEVKVTAADTEICPQDVGSYIMAVAHVTGNAVRKAALDAKRQLFEIVSKELEANIEDLELKDRMIYVKGSPERGIPLKKIVLKALFSGSPVMGKGYHKIDADFIDFRTGRGKQSPTYSFCCQGTQAEVDTETGMVKLLRSSIAHDCGFALNPMDVEGQLEGCLAMAQGGALNEALIWEEGQIMNPSLLDYKIPLSVDMPDIKSIIVESIDPSGPFGAKEGGEAPSHLGPACIANAIYNAVGIRLKAFPIKPESILEALEKKV